MAEILPSFDIGGLSDVGLKRTRNEDSFGVVVPDSGAPQVQQGALFLVADGMGGMGGGDVASQAAIQTMQRVFYEQPPASASLHDRLHNAIEAANVQVREKAKSIGMVRIGATAAGLALLPSGEAVVFNVGDSRVYRIRDNVIELLTRDQSILAHQLEYGLITYEEAKISRNVNVTAFIGQPHTLEPNYDHIHVTKGDVFIICSDGLWDLVEANELLAAVAGVPAQKAAAALIALARERGAPDNVTAIVLRVGGAPGGRMPLLIGAAVALIALLAAGGALMAGMNPAAVPLPTATHEATAELQAVSQAESTEPLAIVIVSTPTDAATMTSTEPAVLPTVTSSSEPGATATVVVSPTEPLDMTTVLVETATEPAAPTAIPSITRAVPAATERPTSTLTATVPASRTPAPTVVASNTALPTASDTTAPSATKPPTATGTTSPTLTATSNAPPANLSDTGVTTEPSPHVDSPVLMIAMREAVRLQTETVMFVQGTTFLSLVEGATLDAGTQVKLVDRNERPDPTESDAILRHVSVIGGTHDGEQGWIAVEALAGAEPIHPYVVVMTESAVVNAVRALPDINSDRVAVLDEAAVVPVLDTSANRWYQVQLDDGRTGWILKNESFRIIGELGDLIPTPTRTPEVTRVRPAPLGTP